MTHQGVYDAVREFLDVLERPMSASGRIVMLRAALDGLAMATHVAEAPFDDRDFEAPMSAEYGALRARIAPLFPELGSYNVVAEITERLGTCGVLVGDAIDDIVDIAQDLLAVVARWERTSQADALWHFRNTYALHWGEHLRNLQLYLYQRGD